MDSPNRQPLDEAQLATLRAAGTSVEAAAAWVLSVEMVTPGDGRRAPVAIVRAPDPSRAYRLLQPRDSAAGAYELTTLGSLADLGAVVARALGLERDPAVTEQWDCVLPASAFAALLAAADAEQAALLQSRLARQPVRRPVLHAALLAREWDRSVATADMSWAGAVGIRVAPEGFAETRPDFSRGLDSLVSSGLLEAIPRGYIAAASGTRAIAVLNSLALGARLSSSAMRNGRWTTLCVHSIFRSAAAGWIAHWNTSNTGNEAFMKMAALTARSAAELVQSHVTAGDAPAMRALPPAPPPAPATASRAGFCTECGKPVDLSKKFCGHCGTRLTS